jgi:molecular chaperone DnaK
MAKGEKIIGIDLGTTNSVVAVMEGGRPESHPQC